MKDKLVKLNKKRVDVINVILTCNAQDKFYYWLKENNVLAEGKTFSLKKLARIFLADNPRYYKEYENSEAWEKNVDEMIRIAKTPWLDEE